MLNHHETEKTREVMSVKILIVDNHKLFREAVRSLLSNESDMDIVGEAEDGRIALQLARELQPNVVIIEISLPNLNGIETTRKITSELPNVKVIALVNNKKTEGFAQTDTLSNNDIVFKYERPQLVFPDRMEYMGASVGKNQWCYPSEERCRFREDGKRCCIHS